MPSPDLCTPLDQATACQLWPMQRPWVAMVAQIWCASFRCLGPGKPARECTSVDPSVRKTGCTGGVSSEVKG